MLRRDNVKTKDSSKTLIFEDWSWGIVLSHNRAIMSQYFFLMLQNYVLPFLQESPYTELHQTEEFKLFNQVMLQ